ncbi:hypothetical protein E8E14_003452 [Neopestalotiopsis sp. 37M]|nr:hypothetical protein E8E14_003452 [Neopestalotiopsis sp. 37M]
MPGQPMFTSTSSSRAEPGPSYMLTSYLGSEPTVTERLAMGGTSSSSGSNTSNRDAPSGRTSTSQSGQGRSQN